MPRQSFVGVSRLFIMTTFENSPNPEGLISYQVHLPGEPLPVRKVPYGIGYVLAANGLFVQATRTDGITALIPTAKTIGGKEVRGLAPLTPNIYWPYPRVSAGILLEMLTKSQNAIDSSGKVVEILFHLLYNHNKDVVQTKERNLANNNAEWQLVVPPQKQGRAWVRPTEQGPESSYARCIIECHSHHVMDAFFSSTDDKDEQGFKIYVVLGNIFEQPQIRVRIGIFGYFYEMPADQIFDLPDGIEDCRNTR